MNRPINYHYYSSIQPPSALRAFVHIFFLPKPKLVLAGGASRSEIDAKKISFISLKRFSLGRGKEK